ncbi:MAG: choice-of-anchor D domain-containing protein [Candidatus Acidiferrum sp.]
MPISVTVLPLGTTSLPAGASVNVTAQVTNDSSNKGVMWSMSCPTAPCGSIAPPTTGSGDAALFTAPSAAPASPVTITATSIADKTKSASVTLNLLTAIVVNLSATVNQVGAGGTSQITAMVSNDPTNQGVNPGSWSISPVTGAGTLSNATSSSVTYTAPATPPPSDVQITITAASASASTSVGTIGITFAAIAVSLTASPGSIDATATSTITASVTFDPANGGVNPTSWTLSGAYGTLSGATSSSVVYTAPSTPPANNDQVTITAAAASDATKTGSTTVSVLAITIQLTPASALIPINNGSQTFTATIANDPTTTPQASWTVTQNGTACTSGCGGVAPTTTASTMLTTYTPPASVPANPSVTVSAASVTDPLKITSATITLSNGTVRIVPNILRITAKAGETNSANTVLTNTGSTTLSINKVSISGGNAADFLVGANTCGASLAPAGTCQIRVTFKPPAVGRFNAGLNIDDSSADSPQLVNLEGTALNFRFDVNHAAVNSTLSSNKAPSVPTPSGPNAVGTRLLDLVDARRSDPFVANGTKRELLVRLWYPAVGMENCARAEYAPVMVWQDFSRLLGVRLPQVTTNSCWNLPMALGAHPVVVFTPGYTGTFTDYTYLFEDLASRGYVVASVNHTYEATAVEFPDGRFAESWFGSHLGNGTRSDEASMAFAVAVRLSDLEFVLDEMERLNRGADTQLAGKLDMTRVALAGHSLGGLTTILGVERDVRFRAGIVIDGAVPQTPMNDTDTPMLLLAAGRDTWTEEEGLLWNSLHGPRLAVNLRGAEHVTPSDLVWLAAGAVETGTMGPEKTIAAVRNYIAAFLDANLLDRPPDVLLTRPAADYPDAVVTLRNQPLHAKNK